MKNNSDISDAAKLLTSHLVAILAASVTYVGMLQLAGLLGTAVGKRLAPVVVPLITSTSAGRRLLGWSLLATGASVAGGVAGAGGSAVVMGTFVGVEKLVTDALAAEDWTKLDEMADELERELESRKRVYAFDSMVLGRGTAALRALGLYELSYTYEGVTGDIEERVEIFRINRAVYGTVSAIKQAFFGRPPSVTGYDADEEQAALH